MADIATLATLEDILDLIGKSSDPAGTATLFARLVQIASFTDSLESLIGSASPSTGGTDTLFKFLKQINDYVDTLEASIGSANPPAGGSDTIFKFLKQINDLITGKVGSNTDAAGTSTLFAYLAQIAGYANTLEGSLGQATDAASSTGTAHAKLKDIKTTIGNSDDPASATGSLHAKVANVQNSVNALPVPEQPRTTKLFTGSTTVTGTWTTILNVNGKGKLKQMSSGFTGSPTGGNYQVRITFDGVTQFSSSQINYNASPNHGFLGWWESNGLMSPMFNVASTYLPPSYELSFKQSLLIEVLNNLTGGSSPAVQASILYEQE